MGNTQSHRSLAMMESCWVDIGKADQIPYPDRDSAPGRNSLVSFSPPHPEFYLVSFPAWLHLSWGSGDWTLLENCNIFSSFLLLQVQRPRGCFMASTGLLVFFSNIISIYLLSCKVLSQTLFSYVLYLPDLLFQSTLRLSEKTQFRWSVTPLT